MPAFGIASAQESDLEAQIADLAAAIDIAWLLIAGILVLFMQAGFGLVEAGFIRSKNVTNILMKNVLDLSFGALGYWAVGWGLAYGTTEFIDIRFFGGGSFFFSPDSGADYAGFFFQFAFAATAATIVSGAVAERTRFSAYLIYTFAITAVIYPIVTHWAWGDGFLSAYAGEIQFGDNGFIDFAGSSVVHSVGGWAALVAAIMLGARRGKFNADGSVNALPGHSMPLGFLGVMILWIGWYGFNAGSTLGLSGGFADLAARVAVTTTLAAGAGAASAMVISWLRSGKSDLSLTLNGVLGGLVGITAGTATVEPWAAVVIGLVAGAIIVYGVALLERFRIDDPVGAVPVHLFNGIWGTLAVGLFTAERLPGPELRRVLELRPAAGWRVRAVRYPGDWCRGDRSLDRGHLGDSLRSDSRHGWPAGAGGRGRERTRRGRARHGGLPRVHRWPRPVRYAHGRGAGRHDRGQLARAETPERKNSMQKIEAIIRPEKLQIVKTALEDLDHSGMTLTEVRGHGVQRGVTEQWRGRSFAVEYLTKIKVELVVADGEVDAVVDRIIEAARTGEVGDGKIFVTPVARAIRIRTGDRDEAAI